MELNKLCHLIHLIVKIFIPVFSYLLNKCQHFHECTNHTLLGGGEGCENQIFIHTLNFLTWFLLFSWGFLALQKSRCVLFFFGGGYQKVYGLYTRDSLRPVLNLTTFCILYYHSYGWLHLEQIFLKKAIVNNSIIMASFPVFTTNPIWQNASVLRYTSDIL